LTQVENDIEDPATELNALCIAAISGHLDGKYRSQKTGTEPI
jgi:hypothetical protein